MKSTHILLSTPVLLHFPSLTHAWGTLGHQTIAYIAQSYLSETAATFIKSALNDNSSSYLANASTWADDYRYTAAGKWSEPLHFIDANDSPPTSCSVVFSRDCGATGCVVSAISNYTAQMHASTKSDVDSDAAEADANLLDATRFVIHFVGDIHQPLHDEALDVGGNTIAVTYDSDTTNLHAIWDTQIPEQLAGGSTTGTAKTWAASLVQDISKSANGWTPSDWLDGISLNDTQTSALGWASEANAFVCSDVLVDGVSGVESGDLDGTYYTKHCGVARTQIARAGYRLGAWLNLIVDGTTGISS